MTTKKKNSQLKIGLVVPHIFMHSTLLPHVIFSPGSQALALAEGLQTIGASVTLLTPGPITTSVNNLTADLSYFEKELAIRGDSYLDLLKKHPFTFVTLARQVQAELIATAYRLANAGEFDIIHIYTNEEDIALPFAEFCRVPVVFTHHDPFNFLVKYKSVFPKYAHLNWLSMSYAQRKGMPEDTHWVGNIYHGLSEAALQPQYQPANDYVAYLGRIIESKGVHLAIEAVKHYNRTTRQPIKLKIAGKHYAGHKKDAYWHENIEPALNETIEYVGFIKNNAEKQAFLGNAKALLVPSTFDEPFGMVMIEALACGTPVIGLSSGAIPEVITPHKTGYVVQKAFKMNQKSNWVIDEPATAELIAQALDNIDKISRRQCRQAFEHRFTLRRMCQEHMKVYRNLLLAT
ncbi:MAG TPA: glycosyltransferase [Candidatus Saccharimonadales bacterium]